ncbi:MAG: class II aldolase/adducin family protein [SAR202 cluster bacterium]|nr:class II aldolase/adducin family protein [SAR202 cluster bacterium]
MTETRAARAAIVETALRMAELGLTSGSSGNISVRLPSAGGRDLMAVTPKGVRYRGMTPDDIPVVDFELEPVEGERTPSSESLMHVAIYRARPDVQAVVHTHAVHSSVFAVTGDEIPPVLDEVVVYLGGPIKVSDYGFPGTQELADNMVRALGERNAAIIRNHGAVGVGRSLKDALDACVLTERVAQVVIYAAMIGKASPLPPDVVEKEMAIFRMKQRGR